MNATSRKLRPSLQHWLALVPTLVVALVAIGVLLGLAEQFHRRFESIGGVLLGAVAAACLLGGVAVLFWNTFDARNLRIIRRSRRGGMPVLVDGGVVGFEGVIETAGEPLIAPFTRAPCAAYTYRISHPGRTSASGRGNRGSFPVAAGFHLQGVRIRGDAQTLHLNALPGAHDAFREELLDPQWVPRVAAFLESLVGHAPGASEEAQHARRLALERSEDLDEINEDYLLTERWGEVDVLRTFEAVLPIGERVCVVGTYDQMRQSLTGRRFRFGPRLAVYRGGADEVSRRVGREVAVFFRFAPVMLVAGAALVLLAWVAPEQLPGVLVEPSAGDPETLRVRPAVVWGLVVATPVLLLWLLGRLSGGATHRRRGAARFGVLNSEQRAPVEPAGSAPIPSPASGRVRISDPIVRSAVERFAKSGGVRAKWLEFDGVDWHFNVDHLTDRVERDRAHDVLTRYLDGKPVTGEETLWILKLLRGER